MITSFEEFSLNEGYNTAESTKLIKKYLKSKYNINASVKSSFYSGGSSLNVTYTGGPDQSLVEKDLSRLQEGNFNGMEDIYDYKDKSERGMVLDGKEIVEYKYVFVRQELPDNFKYELAKMFSEMYNIDGEHPITKPSDYTENFSKPIGGSWSWSELMYRNFDKRNFVTDKLDEVKLLSCEFSPNSHGVYFTYEFGGKTYRTDRFELIQGAVKTVAPVRVPTPKLNNIRLVDYTERSVAVVGNTFEIREKLKDAGGKFNKFLKVDGETVPGWIFSKSKEDEVANILAEYE